MICQNCGENEANVSYTEIVNGKKTKLFLCERCANKMNIGMNFKFDFNDVLGAFFDEPSFVKTIEKPKTLACDVCGTTYEEFANTGMFGCENCYRVFENRLDNVLKRLHGNNRHVARNVSRDIPTNVNIPTKNKKKSELEKLKDELKECIQKEEYEKAAVIRDKIKKLEKNLNEKERGE